MSSFEAVPLGRFELLLDIVAGALFVAFVAFLFVGYENWVPGVPFYSVSPFALFGSLVTLFWANVRADRASRSLPVP